MEKKGLLKKMAVLLIGVMLSLGVAAIVLLLVSGIFQRPAYLEPWAKTYAQKFADPRVRLVAHGLLAANGHNMQPWKIRLDRNHPAVFYLYADSDRLTKEVDPRARQMMISQGTFLTYLAIAGKQTGYRTAIALFPQGDYDERHLTRSMDTLPVAKITLTHSVPRSTPLYDGMFRPDTNRTPYRADKPSAGQLRELTGVNTDDALSVQCFQAAKDMNKLGHYAIKAAAVEAGVKRVMKETELVFRSNEYRKNHDRYGFSLEGQGTSGLVMHFLQGAVTLFPGLNSGKAAADLLIRSTKDEVAHTPAYLMIRSRNNSRRSQVKSGMLYSRLILTAEQQGLAMQPLSQALEEYPEMNELYRGIHRDYAAGGETIQMLVRLGRPTKEVPRSMRRDVTELIIGGADLTKRDSQ